MSPPCPAASYWACGTVGRGKGLWTQGKRDKPGVSRLEAPSHWTLSGHILLPCRASSWTLRVARLACPRGAGTAGSERCVRVKGGQ